MSRLKLFAALPVLLASISPVFGQADDDDLQLNTITTAVPFLMITPDARHGALGEAGVATSPDASATYWNPSKLAFIEEESGVAISYTPWLRQLVNDMGIMYMNGFYRFSDRVTFGAALKYFSLGNITFTDQTGTVIRDHNPNEFSVDASVGTQLSRKFSGGLTARFIYSNLTDGIGDSRNFASSGAVDVSGYYKEDELDLFGQKAEIGVGVNIQNIGAKMSYSTATGEKDFIPTNLKIGQALKVHLDDYNSLTLVTDANKLLVPTPQIDENGNKTTPDQGVASGIFGSFNDAPRGFGEEMEEISYSLGLEYWYTDLIAFRGGYFYEHPNKGDRQYFTAGFGLRLNVFGIDASYLIANRNNPLANTFRFTLFFNIDAFSEQNKETNDEDF